MISSKRLFIETGLSGATVLLDKHGTNTVALVITACAKR